ncbi:hypothetical protein ACLQ2P_11705 [Actinomadura citrea]|uniref:hypothetical protein n=1 Tax=Actinomadura citrea TaxID=46158 RepID=UPI003CE4AE4E
MTSPTAPNGQTSLPVPGDLFARHQTITGLRALADFLEANPAVPVKEYGGDYHVFTNEGDDAAGVALVDQAAALLGVPVHDNRSHGGHYGAHKSFGRISYRIVHIPDRQMDEHNAHMSYRDNIRLDQDDDQGSGRAA